MRFGIGETWEQLQARLRKERELRDARLRSWNDFYPIVPRFVPHVGRVCMETIERRATFVSATGLCAWEYRVKSSAPAALEYQQTAFTEDVVTDNEGRN